MTRDEVRALCLAMPGATEESDGGRPDYKVDGKTFCFHRGERKDAIDAATGARLADVLMFRVPDLDEKALLLADDRGIYFTTPHFDGYAAVLVRFPDLARIDEAELRDLVIDAWLSRAKKRVAKAWLAENDERQRG